MVRITKQIAEQWLVDVEPEKRFWCQDGRVLKNLRELEKSLKEMGDETFHKHVNESNNDFANWVRDVVGDDKLTRDLQKSKTQSQAAKAVADRIAWLKSRAKAG